VEGVAPTANVKLTQTKMTVDFSKDMMIGMLRNGATGTQILDILDVLVPDQTELTREQVCEDLAIADCPENDDEIEAYIANATVAV
jgi:predicted metal-dependent hydrolase